MDAMGSRMINDLEVVTSAIMKKVALNPKVFYIYDLVANLRDPDTDLPFYTGDIGDCVEFTGLRRYGVGTSAIIYDPNSDYMKMRNQRARQLTITRRNTPRSSLRRLRGWLRGSGLWWLKVSTAVDVYETVSQSLGLSR